MGQKGSKSLVIAILSGLCVGVLLFATVALVHHYVSLLSRIWPNLAFLVESPDERSKTLGFVLQKNTLALCWHLLCSALLTAIFEEFFYRACLQNYLSSRVAILPAICFSSLIFAAVHPQAGIFMLIPALGFSILFWKRGLFSSIMAHTTYNGMILIFVSWGY